MAEGGSDPQDVVCDEIETTKNCLINDPFGGIVLEK
jgi:hypothetical protein